MKLSFFTAITTALLVPFSSAAALAGPVTLSYDTQYDNGGLDLTHVACSDGSNGMIRKGYRTAGSLPNFPHIGGAFTVEKWNSVNCGKCYKVTYKGKSVHILAIDHSNAGFNIAKRSMNELTNGQADQLGRIQVTYENAPLSACKIFLLCLFSMNQ
ncbi:heat-stable 19 kDa antigen [Uncinocarpus reesii 1704]|uniref:Heat-stable 19 kDa antigen n=1 Tax=Uncinocarpus reesii (strain UAMH 1704) TaxID=336963 RepID=C4JGD2_UNCRE|nr:heat-stable 19 kDa antigen [Uncinocarpus reesii 1704]EEP76274.1 heat-stable 19 kDa antigen [Uncinocarpus reesii 1704]